LNRVGIALLAMALLLALAWERQWRATDQLSRQQRFRSLLYQLPELLMKPTRVSGVAEVEGELASLWGQLNPHKSSPELARLRQQGEHLERLLSQGHRTEAVELLEKAVTPSIQALDEQLPAYAYQRLRLLSRTRWLAGATTLLFALLLLRRRVVAVSTLETPAFSLPLLRAMKSILLVVNPKGSICAVNQAACDALGYSEKELSGMTFQDIYCERPDLLTMASRRDLEGVYRTQSGSLIPVLIACSVIYQEGRVHSLITLAQDVSQEQLAAAHLESSESRLRALLDRFVGAQEEERRSVARDVHDGVLQYIVAARLQLEVLTNDLAGPSPASLERALAHLQSAVDEGRRLIRDLRPSGLTELGLVVTLRRLVESMGQELGWSTEFHENLGSQALSPALETSLYRIIQEALNNTRKHAQARSVSIRLSLHENWIHLEYLDQGKGFDSTFKRPGMGLQSMTERAELVGGWLQVSGTPGVGTGVRAGLPFQPPVDSAH